MLMEFPNDLYEICFPLRSNKIILELSKLLRIANLERFLETNVAGLKWKMLEFEQEKKSELEKRETDFLKHMWPSFVSKSNSYNKLG